MLPDIPYLFLYVFAGLTIIYLLKILAQKSMLKYKIKKIQERVKKKLFFSHKELIQSMSHEELIIFKQTYDNTVTNAITVQIEGPTLLKNLKKSKVKFLMVSAEDSIDLSIIEGEKENLIK